MAHVLIVDNDLHTVDTFGRLLRADGHRYSTATTGRDAIRIASDVTPDVAVVDYELPDLRGHEVVSAIRSRSPRTSCVMVTACWSLEVEFFSKESGACACVSKPIIADQVTEMVDRACHTGRPAAASQAAGGPSLVLAAAQPHATARIVDKVIHFVASAEDEPTLEGFGRRVGISRGGFRNWCNTSGLKARSVLGFARALRAVFRHQLDPADEAPELLSIVDERTLAKFQLRSGGTTTSLPSTVDLFLERQRFVERPEFVGAVRTAFATSGLQAVHAARVEARIRPRFAVR